MTAGTLLVVMAAAIAMESDDDVGQGKGSHVFLVDKT